MERTDHKEIRTNALDKRIELIDQVGYDLEDILSFGRLEVNEKIEKIKKHINRIGQYLNKNKYNISNETEEKYEELRYKYDLILNLYLETKNEIIIKNFNIDENDVDQVIKKQSLLRNYL